MWNVYIIKLADGTYYKGLTNDLRRRIKQHKQGECYSTKNKLPCTLVHHEKCSTRREARSREKFFKSGEGRELIKQIENARVAELADAQS